MNEDFTFRSVNPQFCKLLGVTPAELIGKQFQDITPVQIRELDVRNAELTKDGKIDFYILPKSYAFQDGSKVDVVLLVTRAPAACEGPFQFFISRIMLDEKGELLTAHSNKDQLDLEHTSHKQMSAAVAFVTQNMKWLLTLGAIIGGALMTIAGVSQ